MACAKALRHTQGSVGRGHTQGQGSRQSPPEAQVPGEMGLRESSIPGSTKSSQP